MRVLVTRPESDGRQTAERLEALGIEATLCPLIEIVLQPIASAALIGASAIVATSRNALRALEASKPALDVVRATPAYVVGPGTEQLARSLGFQTVMKGPGRASELTAVILSTASGETGPIAVLTGDVMAFDLPAALQDAGMAVLRIPAYRSVAAQSLPPDVLQDLRSGRIDAVLLMSPRTAATWGGLVANESAPGAAAITHVCLSAEVAESLPAELKRGKVLIAAEPALEALLNSTKRLADEARSG